MAFYVNYLKAQTPFDEEELLAKLPEVRTAVSDGWRFSCWAFLMWAFLMVGSTMMKRSHVAALVYGRRDRCVLMCWLTGQSGPKSVSQWWPQSASQLRATQAP